MEDYKNILIGTNTFALSWLRAIKKINKKNITLVDFNSITNLKKLIISKNISYILPLSDKDYKLIANIEFNSDVKILYPNNKTHELLHNKMLFTKFMLQHFSKYIPDVYYLNNKKLKDIEYPAISKPIYSKNGTNIVIIYDYDDFLHLNNMLIIQKFIEDEYEYGAYILCIDGIIINYKIIRSKYKKYKIKKTNFPENYENVENFNINIFENIFNKLNYSGGICINFKFNDFTNDLYIFEINPRFGGSAFEHNFIYELLCIK